MTETIEMIVADALTITTETIEMIVADVLTIMTETIEMIVADALITMTEMIEATEMTEVIHVHREDRDRDAEKIVILFRHQW